MTPPKRLFLLAAFVALFAPGDAHAGFETCSQWVQEDKKLSRAIDFLRAFSGQYRLGACQVELNICASYAADDSPGSIAGDLLISDQRGRESYIQIDFSRYRSRSSKIKIQNGRIMFHYEFDDRNPDPLHGRREAVRLEFVKSPKGGKLLRIEAGVYSSRESAKKYQWTICKGIAELPSVAPQGVMP